MLSIAPPPPPQSPPSPKLHLHFLLVPLLSRETIWHTRNQHAVSLVSFRVHLSSSSWDIYLLLMDLLSYSILFNLLRQYILCRLYILWYLFLAHLVVLEYLVYILLYSLEYPLKMDELVILWSIYNRISIFNKFCTKTNTVTINQVPLLKSSFGVISLKVVQRLFLLLELMLVKCWK